MLTRFNYGFHVALRLFFFGWFMDGFLFTSMHSLECWMGLRKKVPSTSGYRSYTNIISLHKMHVMWVFLWAASEDRTNILVSSLPCFPSSSICNGRERKKKSWVNNAKSFKFFFKSRRKIFCVATKQKKFLMNSSSGGERWKQQSFSRARHWTSSLCFII